MTEVWLHANRRALLLGMVVPALLLSGGIALAAAGWFGDWGTVACGGGGLLSLAGLLGLANLIWWMYIPRLARQGDQMLVYLEGAEPTRVPLEFVECFFLGQGESQLPKSKGRDTETKNVVVRLAERARDWAHRDVKPALGHWCEGYITISGAWCEPISADGLRLLNKRLSDAHREQSARASASSEAK